MLLKRLIGKLPTQLAELIPILESLGLKTTENIIYTSRETLFNLIKSSQSSQVISEEDLTDLISFCLDLSVITDNGESIWRENRSGVDTAGAQFGVKGLDGLIGGFDNGIIEISGQKRVGKSLLALHLVLRTLLNDRNGRCHWVDTEGSFNPTRARNILESWDTPSDTISGVLDRLIISPCFQLDPDLFDVLNTIKNDLQLSVDDGSMNADKATLRPRLLVIDPITNLFKDMLMNSSSQGHANMISTMEEIATLTYEHKLITIITNSTASSIPTNRLSSFSSTTIKPSLGTSFTYFSDISLLVQESGKIFGMTDTVERERTRSGPGLRGVVEVLKSRISPSGDWAVFETDGIKLLDVLPPPREDERTLLMSAGMNDAERRPTHGGLAITLAP